MISVENTELEEGEACLYQDVDDTNIDPDIALSHIDEKLQNLLGHFKKDFDGVVSAESLGAKFGIYEYGSFLPAYQQSPVLSHSRSPPRIQKHNTPCSPNTLEVKGGNCNSLVPANVPLSMKDGSTSAVSAASYAYKAPSQNNRCRQNARTQQMQSVEECSPKPEIQDQRTLKVRIKMGSDNFSVKKNAAIYSGLGLDDSPSSSFDGSPTENEGFSRGLPYDVHGAPALILQMMISSPLFGGSLLSPLPDDLIQLSERPCFSLKDNKTFSWKNGMKSLDENGLSLQMKRDGKGSLISFGFLSNEMDIHVVSCEEPVSNALKLPLLADACSTLGNSAGASLNERFYSDTVKILSLEPISGPVSLSEMLNGKEDSAVKAVDNIDADAPDSTKTDSGNIGDSRGEKASISGNNDKVSSKFKKSSKSRAKDPLKKGMHRSTSRDDEMGLHYGMEQLSPQDKKKPKGSKVHDFASRKLAMGSAKDGAEVVKETKDIDNENYASRASVLKRSPLQKDLGIAGDKYKEFFGILSEQEEDIVDSPDVPFRDRLRTCDTIEKATLANENRERASPLETREGEVSGKNGKRFFHNASVSGNGQPISDPNPTGVDTSDNWVHCDKCQKWRLLPPGSKVESLPEMWLCSMLTWLPDMNSCSISEEETTNAVRTRYQLLVEKPNSLHVPFDRLAVGITSVDVLNPMVRNDGKVIDKLSKTSNSSFENSPSQPQSSIRKKQQSVKTWRLTEAKESCVTGEVNFQQLTNDTYVETSEHKKIDNHRSDSFSDGGHAKSSKIESKRKSDQEFPRKSKKSKAPSMPNGDYDQATAHNQGNEMLAVKADSDHGKDGDSLDLFSKSKLQVEASPDVASLHVSKSCNGSIAPQKRKADSLWLGNSISDNEPFSKKKHDWVSKSEGKDSSALKRKGKADKKTKSISQHSSDNIESLEKDSSGAQPHVAATSSSSKVSGSPKAKTMIQEVKGSPVRSVSSSPSRISNLDRLTSGRSVLVEKDNVQDAFKLATGPRKCSDDYEDGNDRCVNEATRGEARLSTNVACSDKSSDDPSLFQEKNQTPVFVDRERESKIEVLEKCGSNVDKAQKEGQVDYDEKRPTKKLYVEKSEHLVSTSTKEKPRRLPPACGEENEASNCPRLFHGNSVRADIPVETKAHKKAELQYETHHMLSKHPISNGHRVKNQDTPSPLRRDSSSQAASAALKEAKNLKHHADRLMNAGSRESTGMYFEAALKFLYGASLLESGKTENAKHGDMIQSMQIYSSTAKLCTFCAHEYEKSKDMATAALAYKCMEVAYLRVIYSSHNTSTRDRQELQTVLEVIPPGESPSSSASDVDNLNNTANGDKAAQVRSDRSPEVALNLVIAANNRPKFTRLLSFAQDVNSAMEASRKSRIAFAAANCSMDKGGSKDGIASIKRALDFNFHDVEGLLRLVRLAKEATSP